MIDEVQLYDHALTTNEVQFLFDNPSLTAIPEPASAALIAFGIFGLAIRRRR